MKVTELIERNEIGSGSRIWIAGFSVHGIGKKVSNKTVPTMVEIQGNELVKISQKTGGYLQSHIIARYCRYEGFLSEQEAIDYYNGRVRAVIQNAREYTEKYVTTMEKNLIE